MSGEKRYIFELELSPEEMERLWQKAGRAGWRPEELLAYFIADMTGSVRSGGSDEEELAGIWFERRAENPVNAFLSYLMNYELLETALQLQESADACLAIIKNTEENLDRGGHVCQEEFLPWTELRNSDGTAAYAEREEWEQEEREYLREAQEELEGSREQLKEIWNGFRADSDKWGYGAMKEEMQRIREWQERRERQKQAEDGTVQGVRRTGRTR